jgi:hypothetical protein
VDALPKSSDFHLSAPEENFTPTTGGASDSPDAIGFKDSLKDMYRLMQLVKVDIPAKPAPVRIDLKAVASSVLDQIRPEKTVPAWTRQQIFLPAWIRAQLPDEDFVEAMGYPKINKAMYSDLKSPMNCSFPMWN